MSNPVSYYRVGAPTVETYAPTDSAGALVQVADLAIAPVAGLDISEPVWDAETGFTFTVTPDDTALDTTGCLVLTGTDPDTGDPWRDVIYYVVVRQVTSDLCSVEDVKNRANVPDDAEDALIQGDIIVASKLIRDYTGTEFTTPVSTQTRYYRVDGATVFLPHECISVTSLKDADDNALTFTAVPGTLSTDPLRWLELAHSHTGTVTVAGTWGFSEVPADIREACTQAVVIWRKRRKLSGEDDRGYLGGLKRLPQEITDLLDSWRWF